MTDGENKQSTLKPECVFVFLSNEITRLDSIKPAVSNNFASLHYKATLPIYYIRNKDEKFMQIVFAYYWRPLKLQMTNYYKCDKYYLIKFTTIVVLVEING